MKKISIIGTVGLPAKYGGWETLTDHLTRNLSTEYEITVYCSAKKYPEQLASYNGAKLEYINLDANGAQSIPYDILSMLKSLKFADTLVILGVSGCVFLPILRMLTKKKLVVNIDGLEWKRAKWGNMTKKFLKLSEALAVRFADIVVSDNKAIQEYIQDEYGRESQLIAYGADHATSESLSDSLTAQYPFLNQPYAFKVCRIEPENNLDMILEAFEQTRSLPLAIIGNWSNSLYGQNLKAKYQDATNIHLIDPIYDQQILNQFRSNCSLYVHGHSAGGTNPSLVEAMYLGLPIVAFSIAYNVHTTHGKAKYFTTSQDLVEIIESSSEVDLQAIAQSLKEVAEENYTWKRISEQYAQLF